MWQSCSETFRLLLSEVSPSLSKSLCSALAGNIVTTAFSRYLSMLQITVRLLTQETNNPAALCI